MLRACSNKISNPILASQNSLGGEVAQPLGDSLEERLNKAVVALVVVEQERDKAVSDYEAATKERERVVSENSPKGQ
jgi:hypothetical protein